MFWNSLPSFAVPGRGVFKEIVSPKLELVLNEFLTGPSLKMSGTLVAVTTVVISEQHHL